MVKLAIVVPSIYFNRLGTFLGEITALDPPPDLLILLVPRNIMKDLSILLEKKYFKLIGSKKPEIIILEQKKGLIEARNKGIIVALRRKADLVWLAEDDIIICNKKVIGKIKKKYSELLNIRIGAFFGSQKVESMDSFVRPLQHIDRLCGSNRSSFNFLSIFLCLGYLIFLKIHGFNGLPYLVPAATLVLTKEAIREVGLFFEGFKESGEWSEPDLIKRILDSRFNVIRIKSFVIRHCVSSSKYFSLKYWVFRLHNFLLYIMRAYRFHVLYLLLAMFFVFGAFLLSTYRNRG